MYIGMRATQIVRESGRDAPYNSERNRDRRCRPTAARMGIRAMPDNSITSVRAAPSGRRPEAIMVTGTVKWFDSKKGFGFIQGDEEGKDIFVHYSSIEGEGFRALKDGESVEYELVQSDKGLQAQNVRRIARIQSAQG